MDDPITAVVGFPLEYSPRTHVVGFAPTAAIFENPAVGVCINEEWIPFILGVLEVLALPELWPHGTAGTYVSGVEKLMERLAKAPVNDCASSAPTETWCHTLDFTEGDQGFQGADFGTGALAEYHSGVGWFDTYPSHVFDGIYINAPLFPQETVLTSCFVYFTDVIDGPNPHTGAGNYDGSDNYADVAESGVTVVSMGFVDHPNTFQLQVWHDRYVGGLADIDYGISKLVVCGQGTDPFTA